MRTLSNRLKSVAAKTSDRNWCDLAIAIARRDVCEAPNQIIRDLGLPDLAAIDVVRGAADRLCRARGALDRNDLATGRFAWLPNIPRGKAWADLSPVLSCFDARLQKSPHEVEFLCTFFTERFDRDYRLVLDVSQSLNSQSELLRISRFFSLLAAMNIPGLQILFGKYAVAGDDSTKRALLARIGLPISSALYSVRPKNGSPSYANKLLISVCRAEAQAGIPQRSQVLRFVLLLGYGLEIWRNFPLFRPARLVCSGAMPLGTKRPSKSVQHLDPNQTHLFEGLL